MSNGSTSGDIAIFEIEQNWEHDRTFSLRQWGIRSEGTSHRTNASPISLDTGNVSCLSWSPDFRALSVGYEKRGFSLWSIYGCRLHCSLPHLDLIKIHQQEDHHLTPTKRDVGISELETKMCPELLRGGLACMVFHVIWSLFDFF